MLARVNFVIALAFVLLVPDASADHAEGALVMGRRILDCPKWFTWQDWFTTIVTVHSWSPSAGRSI